MVASFDVLPNVGLISFSTTFTLVCYDELVHHSYKITFFNHFIFSLKTYNSRINDVQYETYPSNTLFFKENQSLKYELFPISSKIGFLITQTSLHHYTPKIIQYWKFNSKK